MGAALPELAGIGDQLVDRYADPSRAYHDVHHLAEVLYLVDLLGNECTDPATVELAAWFHDAVYDVAASDNEAASAELAGGLLTPYLDAAETAEVVRLVSLTSSHAVAAGDANGAVLCDADLAVLARDRRGYDAYAAQVRLEYDALPDEAFRVGRADVLSRLLALPSLYHTAHGRCEWEAGARANLQPGAGPLSGRRVR